MEADIQGAQRKVFSSEVRPRGGTFDEAGIRVRKGSSLPFSVRREWSAPAGHYPEVWFLVDPETREVLYEGPTRDVLVWGLQSLTELTDEVTVPIALRPGNHKIVFALGGLKGGEIDVPVSEEPAESAA
ncbi:MAG: hypothetical protein ABR575_04715 [Actinomycetota bacterium]